MKKLKYILILLLSISIWSCEDDDADINIMRSESIEGMAILNTPAVASFEIIETVDAIIGNEDDEATTFNWSKVTGNYNGVILYFLEIDIKGNDFKNAVYLPLSNGGTTELSQKVTNNDLNLAVNSINTQLVNSGSALAVDFSKATEFNVRVVATSDISKTKSFSEPISIMVNAYEKIVVIEPKLFLVGSVQAYYATSGWSPEKGLALRYIGDGTTKVFEAYVKADAGDEFKLISNQADWADVVGNYGVISGAQDGNLMNGSDSGNLKITEKGHYYIQVDIDNLTYKLVKMKWGIIGSSTPNAWDGETAMTYDFVTNSWKIDVTLTDGEIKFRAKNTGDAIYDGEWKFNIGSNLTAWDEGDGNFNVSAGSASISLKIDFKGKAEISGI